MKQCKKYTDPTTQTQPYQKESKQSIEIYVHQVGGIAAASSSKIKLLDWSSLLSYKFYERSCIISALSFVVSLASFEYFSTILTSLSFS